MNPLHSTPSSDTSIKRKTSTPNSCFNSKIGKFVNVNHSTILPSTCSQKAYRTHQPDSADKTPQTSKISIHDTLMQSFIKRQSLHNDTSTRSDLSVKETESTWSVFRKSKTLSNVNCIEHIKHFDSVNNSADISQNKLIKYRPGTTAPVNLSKIDWENPILGTSDQRLPSATSTKVLSRNNFDRIYSSFRFNKEMLLGAKVIGQVDNRFIACLLPDDAEAGEKILVLMDQHAAHERVRLEKLLKQIGYYEPETCRQNLKSQICSLSPPAEMFFTDSNIDQLLHFSTEFHKAGIYFTTMKTKNHSNTDLSHSYRVLVSSVPSIFVNVCQPQSKARGTSINVNLLKEYILEQSKMMRTCASKCSIVSPVIFKVLASYACHGAIKFGDPLEHETCIKIMNELSQCQLPFQCAHGRPSIAPLVRLSMLKSFLDRAGSKGKRKPNLQNLKRRMKQ